MQNRVYIPGLNGIRFFAALFVIVDHVELFKSYFGIKTFWSNEYSSYLGSLGVTIFFVLSGFLITYLLLKEKEYSKDINLKNFYVRRILRIWPLYYLILILGFFVFSNIQFFNNIPEYQTDISKNFYERFFLFLFLFANIGYVFYEVVPFANVLWSIGVEEQFYLFWPVLIKTFKKYYTLIGFFIFSLFCLRVLLYMNYTSNNQNILKLIELYDRTRFSCMVIGAFGAVLMFKSNKIIKILQTKIFQVFIYAILILVITNSVTFKYYFYFKTEFISITILLFIINIIDIKSSIINFEKRILVYLGKISYGLYVYHLIFVVISINIFSNFFLTNNYIWINILLYLVVIGLTILISSLSYKYFEGKFLKKKESFSTIISGDLVKQRPTL